MSGTTIASRIEEGFSGKGLLTVGSQSSDCLLALLTVPHKNQPEGPTFSDRVSPSAFSLAMRSFQQNVGIYQMAERPLAFLVQILTLHKAATSGVSCSGTKLRTQELLVHIRHLAASIMVGVSSYVA